MTNSEFKKKVAEATDLAWFKNVEATFNFPYLNINTTLKGLPSIYEYLNQQIFGWEKLGSEIPSEFLASKTTFVSIRDLIVNFVNQHINQSAVSLSSLWTSINKRINQLPHIDLVLLHMILPKSNSY